MKKEYTNFICDECKKSEYKERGIGFPYEKGWCYIHRFIGKVLQLHTPAIQTDVAKIKIEYKHFCCEEHLWSYIRKKVDEAKKIDYKEIKLGEKNE